MEMIACLDGARSVDELRDRLLRLTKTFGVERIIAGMLPDLNAATTESQPAILLADWPTEWLSRYFSRGYVSIDPTIRTIRISNKAFTLDQMPAFIAEDPISKLVMNEAREFKLFEGITVPLMTAEGKPGGFYFAGQHLDMRESTIGILSLLANYAFAKAVMLDGAVSAAPALAPRQMDVIRWAAEGKTDWEIGMILDVSEHTVDKYLRQVKEKLGAANRVQMIATAIRLGLIT
jgi:LuxR family quorum sensing-dependent transcriptional regulator